MYIHQHQNWPNFTWDHDQIATLLAECKFQQGKLLGKMQNLGFKIQEEALLQTLTTDIIKSSEIEGEILELEQVRSSLARHLGIALAHSVASNRNVDSIVEMILDATRHYDSELNEERLCAWQASLFPTGRSGLHIIATGMWRYNNEHPMQVISGHYGREKIHFQAPAAEIVPAEMARFLNWFNNSDSVDPLIRAGIAHIWFLTIHPFEDGNGRIARALTDMLLARSEKQSLRFYSMSAEIRLQRNAYYEILEKTQKGSCNITNWLMWFLRCFLAAIKNSESLLERVLNKAHFWEMHLHHAFNERQRDMLNRLFDGFIGTLTSSKWAKMQKCSQDTASRDINDLIQKSVLIKDVKSGRSTNYLLKDFPINYIG